MSEQQYRVIADATMNDLRTGDLAVVRVSEGYEDGAWSAEPGIVRIERPVPTTDEDTEQWHREQDARLARMRALDGGGKPSLPTREQFAETLYRQQQRPAVRIVWSELPEWVQSVYFEMADAVLALLQKGADRG